VSKGTKIRNPENPLGHEQEKPFLGHYNALKRKKETKTLPSPKQNLFTTQVEELKEKRKRIPPSLEWPGLWAIKFSV